MFLCRYLNSHLWSSGVSQPLPCVPSLWNWGMYCSFNEMRFLCACVPGGWLGQELGFLETGPPEPTHWRALGYTGRMTGADKRAHNVLPFGSGSRILFGSCLVVGGGGGLVDDVSEELWRFSAAGNIVCHLREGVVVGGGAWLNRRGSWTAFRPTVLSDGHGVAQRAWSRQLLVLCFPSPTHVLWALRVTVCFTKSL